MPDLRSVVERLREDVRVVLERDPAARSVPEVVTCYPGLHALWLHRVAHRLWGVHPLAARLLSHLSRFLTGVEIHPGAHVGRRCAIDHGAGVVIGETADIGDDVHMYHGVTLGGDDPRPVKRHPTVEDDVVLGANATLIGDITVGEGARVGAGSVVVESVPAGQTVVGNPARPVDDGEGEDGRVAAESPSTDGADARTDNGDRTRCPDDETRTRRSEDGAARGVGDARSSGSSP